MYPRLTAQGNVATFTPIQRFQTDPNYAHVYPSLSDVETLDAGAPTSTQGNHFPFLASNQTVATRRNSADQTVNQPVDISRNSDSSASNQTVATRRHSYSSASNQTVATRRHSYSSASNQPVATRRNSAVHTEDFQYFFQKAIMLHAEMKLLNEKSSTISETSAKYFDNEISYIKNYFGTNIKILETMYDETDIVLFRNEITEIDDERTKLKIKSSNQPVATRRNSADHTLDFHFFFLKATTLNDEMEKLNQKSSTISDRLANHFDDEISSIKNYFDANIQILETMFNQTDIESFRIKINAIEDERKNLKISNQANQTVSATVNAGASTSTQGFQVSNQIFQMFETDLATAKRIRSELEKNIERKTTSTESLKKVESDIISFKTHINNVIDKYTGVVQQSAISNLKNEIHFVEVFIRANKLKEQLVIWTATRKNLSENEFKNVEDEITLLKQATMVDSSTFQQNESVKELFRYINFDWSQIVYKTIKDNAVHLEVSLEDINKRKQTLNLSDFQRYDERFDILVEDINKYSNILFDEQKNKLNVKKEKINNFLKLLKPKSGKSS